jgi:DNA-binding NtrC family response regulator
MVSMNLCSAGENGDPEGRSDQTQDGHGRRILLVDDDEDMRSLLSDVLSDEGYEVVQANNGAEALLFVHREVFAAILLDKNMPGLSGMDLLPGLRMVCPHTPVIIITAFGDSHTAGEGTEKGASGCLFKPFRMDDLTDALHLALTRREPPVGTRARQG